MFKLLLTLEKIWDKGKSISWEVSVLDTYTESHIFFTATWARSDRQETGRRQTYAHLSRLPSIQQTWEVGIP